MEQFAGAGGNSVSVWGEPTALSGAHPSMLWSAQGAGPGALSLPLLLTHKDNINKRGDRRSSRALFSFLGRRAQFRFPCCHTFSLQDTGLPGSPGMPSSSALMSPGRAARWRTPSLPVGRAFIYVSLFGVFIKPPKLMNVLLCSLTLH